MTWDGRRTEIAPWKEGQQEKYRRKHNIIVREIMSTNKSINPRKSEILRVRPKKDKEYSYYSKEILCKQERTLLQVKETAQW
jgi:hypothetical protein